MVRVCVCVWPWLLCAALTAAAAAAAAAMGSKQNAELTFLLPAGRRDCFYQTTARDQSMEVEYQVIAGSGLDVGFVLVSPGGQQVVSDHRRSHGIHMVDATEGGDYQLCFDNSFSKFSQKMVFFELHLNAQGERGGGGASEGGASEGGASEGRAEAAVEEELRGVREQLDGVQQRLERGRQLQAALRSMEARDRYLLEDNLWRVSFWSCLSLLVVVAVATTQIYTLKSLFQDTKRVTT